MIVTRQDFTINADYYSLDYQVPRSVGCHLMDVINYMDARRPKRNDEDRDPNATWFGGYLWEHVMARQAIERECRGNEHGVFKIGQHAWCYECDTVIVGVEDAEEHFHTRNHHGIFATPDAVIVRGWRLKEWKFTKKSLRRAGADLWIPLGATQPQREREEYEHIAIGRWPWVAQTKSYSWLIGDMTVAEIEACFVEGDYGLSTRDAVTTRYTLEFTQRELNEQWSSIVNHAIDGELLKVA